MIIPGWKAMFLVHVRFVIGICSEKEMLSIVAWWVVAAMTNEQMTWVFTKLNKIGNATGPHSFPTNAQCGFGAFSTLSTFPSPAIPVWTLSRGLVYMSPKFLDFSGGEFWNCVKLVTSHVASFVGDKVRTAECFYTRRFVSIVA